MIKISPSILSADFSVLGEEIQKLDAAKADMIHIDVMDGHFVSQLTFGPCVIKSIRNYTKLPFDVHLMIDNPELSIDQYIKAGADIITIHPETTTNLNTLIRKIKDSNVQCAIAILPSYSHDMIDNVIQQYINYIDLILVMTVNPGLASQKFIYKQLDTIRYISQIIQTSSKKILVSIDGGINEYTSKLCIEAGANVLVSGSFILNNKDYKTQMQLLRH